MGIGLCECGCGKPTNIAKKTQANQGVIKGQPYRFLLGHNKALEKRDKNPQWKGGKHLDCFGYVLVLEPEHGRAGKSGHVMEHVAICEEVLGKSLPPKAEVHHVNRKRNDNRKINLVICEDRSYHRLLHQRARALEACGNANFRKCARCGEYDDPSIMRDHGQGSMVHYGCHAAYNREHRRLKGGVE